MSKILFEKIKKINLPIDQYAIFGSGPLGIKNIRECRDIDLIVTDSLFNKIKENTEWTYKQFKRDGRIVQHLEKDNIEIYDTWGPGNWDIKKLIEESEIINNLPFVQLKECLKWKEMSGREKDKKDVKLIKKYLNK